MYPIQTEIETCLTSLRKRHINGIFARDPEEAASRILSLIPREATVGMGDSSTVRRLDIVKRLMERGTRVLDPFKPQGAQISPEDAHDYTERISREATLCDVFLAGTNALTRDGRLVNVDAVGNRVAGMFWGHSISIIVVGRNKIVRDLEAAFDRIRNTIAPMHSYTKTKESGGRKAGTPCAITGECNDCKAVDRKCNIFTIIESKPLRTTLNVVIVNEDLGLGWDPAWSEDRIGQIMDNHKKYLWKPRFDVQ